MSGHERYGRAKDLVWSPTKLKKNKKPRCGWNRALKLTVTHTVRLRFCYFFYLYANAGSVRETWHGYRRHLLLHNDRISLHEMWLAAFHSCGFSLQVLASSSPVILLFTHFDEPKNSLELANPTRNIRLCSTKLMTITSGEINLQSKRDIICHVAKVKPATSAHYLADVIPFLSYVIFPSNPTLR